jgi:hypothetical protein
MPEGGKDTDQAGIRRFSDESYSSDPALYLYVGLKVIGASSKVRRRKAWLFRISLRNWSCSRRYGRSPAVIEESTFSRGLSMRYYTRSAR